MPHGCRWNQIGAVAILGGIGFTVSLFIANLSFGTGDPFLSSLLDNSRLGILVGSLLAGVLGYFALHLTLSKAAQDTEK